MGFLQQTNGWRESLKAIGSSHNQDVKSNLLSIPEKSEDPDKQFESYKTYATELHVSKIKIGLVNLNVIYLFDRKTIVSCDCSKKYYNTQLMSIYKKSLQDLIRLIKFL